ncbi:MAG: hypothetical protein MZV63_16645 [Marinilabiliales bacterium]|nr:hypothetical protein [Marinilabiliales bacterium]
MPRTGKSYGDEENRIKELSDNGELLRYAYDASGTRVYKSKGNKQTVSINGKKAAETSGTGNYTIYVNPYQEVYSGGYTKHVFIEGQRIATTYRVTGNSKKLETFQYYYHPDHRAIPPILRMPPVKYTSTWNISRLVSLLWLNKAMVSELLIYAMARNWTM